MTSTGILPEANGLADIRYKVSAFLSAFIPKGEKQMNKEAMKQQIVEALSKKSGDGFVTVIRNH